MQTITRTASTNPNDRPEVGELWVFNYNATLKPLVCVTRIVDNEVYWCLIGARGPNGGPDDHANMDGFCRRATRFTGTIVVQ